MMKKAITIFLTLLFVLMASLLVYTLQAMKIEHLVMCSSGDSNMKIPANICNSYMNTFRMTESDMESLRAVGGLVYVLNGENKKKYDIAKNLISNGLGVNEYLITDGQKLTPLHVYISTNEPDEVTFLLSQQADPSILNSQNLTPLELAKKLHKPGDTTQDRTEIIQILSTKNSGLISTEK